MIISINGAMDKNRQILRLAVDAMHRTSAAIGSVIDSEAAPSALSYVSDLYLEIRNLMINAGEFMCDEWEKIVGNGARKYEISIFMEEYRVLRERVIAFDDWRIEKIGEGVMDQDGADIAMDFVILICECDRLFSYVFKEIDGNENFSDSPSTPSLKGLTARLSKYIFGIDDELLSRALLKRDFPALRPTWIGRKNDATYFGKHFKLSCEDMNSLFLFQGKNRQAMKLNYSRNDDDKITAMDEIAVILSDFPM